MGTAVATLVLTAAAGAHGLHAAASSLVALGIVGMAVRENQQPITCDADARALAAANTRTMGMIWAYTAAAIYTTYQHVLEWSSWPAMVLGVGGLAVLCLAASNLFNAEPGETDARPLVRLARLMATVQLAGAAISLAAFWHTGKIFGNGPDWAANNILLFAALSIAILSIVALRSYAQYFEARDGGNTARA